jgi:hypothetical protein
VAKYWGWSRADTWEVTVSELVDFWLGQALRQRGEAPLPAARDRRGK